MADERGDRLIHYEPQPDGTTRRVVTYGTAEQRYRAALERIAGADLKRTNAGYLANIAKGALGED